VTNALPYAGGYTAGVGNKMQKEMADSAHGAATLANSTKNTHTLSLILAHSLYYVKT